MPQTKRMAPVTIQGARIIFRNFSGRKGPYNEEGERGFTLVVPEDLAAQMMRDGWNIKEKPAYNPDEGDAQFDYHLAVKVEYRKGRPPRCVLVNSRGRTELGADEVGVLDFAEISNFDLTVSPYTWNRPDGSSGVSAYLKTLFATIVEDPLEALYADIPEARPVDLGDEEFGEDD